MNKAFHQKKISQTLRQVAESVLLGDWRTLSKEEILQDAARLRSVKAQYVATHFAHQLEIHQEVLSPLDQTLLALYLLLDTLEGRNLARQREMYQALLEAQTPLLLACSIVPSEGSVQVSEDNAFPQIAERSANGNGLEEPLLIERESIRPDQEAVVPDLALTKASPSQEESTTVEKEGAGASSTWFRWTPEREHQLQATITALVGSLDQVDTASIKQIAKQNDWSWRSVEYKVRRLKAQQPPSEAQKEHEAPAKEGD